MAQLILSEVGGYIGGRLAPQGVTLFGQQITGQAIGSYVGSLAGSAIDAYLFAPRYEGPRISQLHLTQSVEGASVPNVYGRMRVGCNLIWAARFQENKEESGKGGPKTTTYSYTLSFAVGLCEGEISRISRAWANGAEFDLSSVNWRLYRGTEDQASDPLIEAIEGTGAAPAYKGLAYIVFEDLPMDDFGVRIPQLSFEVVRSVGGEDRMEAAVTGMNLIPGSGEFAYATEIIRREIRLGVEEAENHHTGAQPADFLVSLEHLVEDFPNLTHVNLIVGWFGTSTDCAQCEIKPGVERRDRRTKPRSWYVAGQDRESAYLVSTDEDGLPNYGGTPDDQSVKQAIWALKLRGLKVTLYPFLFMDAPGFPWRGRISCDPAIDATSDAATAVALFFGTSEQQRYRRFILHYAQLAFDAGGVDAILIGSEMVGLTRIRSASGVYPAVDELIQLAGEVRAIVGAGTKISYAADWTEYGAYLPQDGSNDVDFPLDDLWAAVDIDFVGLDWYPPLGDWRDGAAHLDAAAGYVGPDDPAYLQAQIEGGEAYDFYYADDADRASQVRTAINDTAYGEHWVFRQKDLRNWWSHAHHRSPGGVKDQAPTAWTPGSKPVRFVEFGCPAVDKGANQPNVFYDPKSTESALPRHSSGARDDVIQRRAVEAFCRYWADDPIMDEGGISVWAWDMRPYPAWPLNADLWADGGNWRLGHWLNGRTGHALLPDVIADLNNRAGLSSDVSGLNGLVAGYALDGVLSLRDALEPLHTVFDIVSTLSPEGLAFSNQEPIVVSLTENDLVMPDQGAPVEYARSELEPAGNVRIRLAFIDSEEDSQPGVVLSTGEAGAPVRDMSLPLLLDRDQAQRLVDDLADRALDFQNTASFALSPAKLDVEPGDIVSYANDEFTVVKLTDGIGRRVEAVQRGYSSHAIRAGAAPSDVSASPAGAEPVVAIIDAPPLPGEEDDARPIVFAGAVPWSGPVEFRAGPDEISMTPRCTISNSCVLGELISDAPVGVPWRWSKGELLVQLVSGALSSRTEVQVLNGANAALLETPGGWELLQFTTAELVGEDIWRLTGLLRGQQGSERLLSQNAASGARIAFLTGAEQRMEMNAQDYDLDLVWSAQASGADANAVVNGVLSADRVATLEWSPAHLAASRVGEDLQVDWIRRGRIGGDGWEAGEPILTGAELYLVEFKLGSEVLLARTVTTPSCTLSSEEVAALGSAFDIHVAQLGSDQRPGFEAILPVTISP